LDHDIAGECEAQAGIRAAYDHAAMAAPARGHAGAAPIFIVGMPRTGTTLVERMLVQGGHVRSAGEPPDLGNLTGAHAREALRTRPQLTPAQASLHIDFEALGREYARGAAEAAGAARFIDKMPANYMYCGIIRKALPEARIIHLQRDPLDSC